MAFTRDPDPAVREWALNRLLNIVPMQGAMRAIELVGQGVSVRWPLVLDRVRQMGRRDLGLALFECWERLDDPEARATAIEVFRSSGTVEALPAVREVYTSRSEDINTQFAMFEAIGQLGDLSDREPLRRVVRDERLSSSLRAAALRALLCLRHPQDIAWMMDQERPADDEDEGMWDSALIDSLDLIERYYAMGYDWPKNLELQTLYAAACDALEMETLPLSGTCMSRLLTAEVGSALWFRALFVEASALTAARADDLEGWARRAPGAAPPIGYRWWAVATLEFLRAAMVAPQRSGVAAVALLATVALAMDEDDEARLASATNVEAALLELCGCDRDRVLPGVVDRVVAMGPRVVPALREALGRATRVEPRRRLVTALFGIELDHPGSIVQAGPELLSIPSSDGCGMTEQVAWMLLTIGPSLVPGLREAAHDPDRSLIALEVLPELGTPEAADALFEMVSPEPRDRSYWCEVLAETLDPRLLSWIAAGWEPRDILTAERLCVMLAVHGLHHPDLPRWLAARAQHEARLAQELRWPLFRAPQPEDSYN